MLAKKMMALLLSSAMVIGMGTTVYAEDTYENGMSKTEDYELKIGWFDAGNGTGMVDATIKIFEELYPNVKITVAASADHNTHLDAMITAGGEDMWDTFYVDPQTRPLYAQAGLLEPLDELWDAPSHDTEGKVLRDLAQDYSIEFSYTTLEDGTSHAYGFPYVAGGYFSIYYDKAVFAENGWNENPQTWQEFLDLCETIKAAGVTPLVYTGVHDYLTDALMASKSFELAAEAGEVDAFNDVYRYLQDDYYTNAYMTGFWSKLAELGKLGYWHEGLAGMNHTQSQMQVIQGNCAMVCSGSWIGNEMKDSTPEGFEWGMMTIPMRETADTPLYVTGSFDQCMSIYSGASDDAKTWAKEFIRLMWDMEAQIGGAKHGTLSIRKDYADDPERLAILDSAMASGAEYVAKNDAILLCTTQLRTISDAEYAQTQQFFNDNKVDMVLGNVDVNEVLTKCQEGLDAVNNK